MKVEEFKSKLGISDAQVGDIKALNAALAKFDTSSLASQADNCAGSIGKTLGLPSDDVRKLSAELVGAVAPMASTRDTSFALSLLPGKPQP
jgi:hypothetical protein